MEKKYFEDMLYRNINVDLDAEKMWDERANSFNNPNHLEHYGFSDDVLRYANEHNILKNADVLDIGGGGGRYSTIFAKYSKSVTMTDISGNMIEFARQKSQKEGIKNITFEKLAWEHADLDSLNWTNKFDFVFASMCPAVRIPKGLYNMSKASKSDCMILQFIKDTDSFYEFLMKEANLAWEYNPHNDRDAVQASFNLLWMDGYNPRITYLHDDRQLDITSDMLAEYNRVFERMEKEKNIDSQHLIDRYFEIYGKKLLWHRTLAILHWNVNQKKEFKTKIN